MSRPNGLPVVHYDEDDEDDATTALGAPIIGRVTAVPVVYDDEAITDEPTHTSAFTLESAASSDVGRARRRNEDSYATAPEHGLFVVADGMGGHRGGAVASELAARSITSAFRDGAPEVMIASDLPRRARQLASAIYAANESVRSAALGNRDLEGMGTTVVAALFAPAKRRLYIGHVGDSRCYRLRAGKLERLTQDHTLRELGAEGNNSAGLSRWIGGSRSVLSDFIFAEPRIGDVYLLCSDGLTNMVHETAIERILREETDPNEATWWLIDQANRAGGADNITVVVVRVMPADHRG